MEDNYQPIQIYQKILEMDYENKVCVECKCPMPSFVSINNAIILCDKCAERHQRLGYNVSYVRNITSDWDPYLFSFLERGGNSRFIRLSKKFQLDDMPIEQKFNTRIVEYYRLLVSKKIIYFYLQLKSEVLAEEPPYEVPYENAKDPINNQIIYFPEFQEYQIYVGKLIPKKKTSEVIEAFRYVGNGLGTMGNYLAEKYQENDMNNKLIEGGVLAAKGVGVVGKALYKVAKPVVKFTTIKAIQGIGYLCNQAVNLLSDTDTENKDKIEDVNGEKIEEDKKIEQINPNPINQQNSLDLPDGGQLVFQQSEEYPTFESIDRIYKNNNNNNIMQNNLNNGNNNINNIQNQNNINMMYNNQYNNNQVQRPDYSAARGLDYSIIGEI